MAAKTIRAKKACCRDDPRCKRCPVVLKRLAALALAEREDKRTYRLPAPPPKKALKAVRAR